MSLYGRRYIIDHFNERVKRDQIENQYRVYITDMLKNLVSGIYGGNVDIPRYDDIINPKIQETEKTAEEIIDNVSNILNKLGE